MKEESKSKTFRIRPLRSIHRRLYDWVLHWADTPYGLSALVIIAFLESSIFPIPPDVLIVALVISKPQDWVKIAGAATIASVIGGLAGYGIGRFFWEAVGLWTVNNVIGAQLEMIGGRPDILLPPYMVSIFGDAMGGNYLFQVYDRWNAWVVFIFGLTPLPYKLVTITAGVAQLDFVVFSLTSVFSRGLRFFLLAAILRKIGSPAKVFIEKHFNILCILFVIVLVGGFLLVKILI